MGAFCTCEQAKVNQNNLEIDKEKSKEIRKLLIFIIKRIFLNFLNLFNY